MTVKGAWKSSKTDSHPLGLGELLHGLLQVAQGTLNQALVFLEVVEQDIPKRLPAEHLGVAQND